MAYKKRLEGITVTKSLAALVDEARAVAQESKHDEDDAVLSSILNFSTASSSAAVLPLSLLRDLASLLGQDRVETALEDEPSSLVFTPPAAAQPTKEQERFQKRLERLRLKEEETRYSKLTNNIGKVVQDDVTTRSMTYAASIGLNMIIAPLSFGVFMYFFGGGILDWIWPRDIAETHGHTTDIRKVIMGVVSGVLMLFIEMLLFVIRTHEMDRAMRRKQRQRKDGPFGHYTSKTSKTFKEE